MRTYGRILLVLLLVELWGCTRAPSVNPPPGWVKVATTKFELFVPPWFKPPRATNNLSFSLEGPELRPGSLLDTNFGRMEVSFDWGRGIEDFADFTKNKHYMLTSERIGGKRAKVVSFYYEPWLLNELIAIYFPEADGRDIQFSVLALCRSTNDYEIARTMFRTIRFK